jgi:hypothetical protein
MKRNMSEQVTWLLPVKNGMPYLSETLASIEAQTYKSWEVLVWDNGSTDGTVEELKKWIPSRLPGRVVTDSPLPLGESLAEMVRQANTEFCARIDADDINFPERLEKQVDFLLKNPDVAVLGSQIECIDNRGKKHRERLDYPLQHDDIVHTMLRVCAMSHPAITFRRSAILEIGNYRDVFVAGQRSPSEDYDLWLRIATRFKLANLDLTLLKYRIHDRSINQISGAENQAIQVQNDCFCRNAPLLYGCSEEDARLIREWRHPDPVEVLIQIAAYLDAHQKSDLQDRLRSQSFIGAGREMMSSKDIISCLRWATLNQNKLAILGEFCTIARRGKRFFRFPKMLNPQN